MKAFDEQGNIVDVPDATPVNDLTKAPKLASIPPNAIDAMVLIPASDGVTPRIARIPVDVLLRGSVAPGKDTITGEAGSSMRAAPADHTHPARSIGSIITLNAQGLSTWNFSRPFSNKPVMAFTVEQTTGAPLIVEVNSWVMNGTDYVGCTIKAYRSQTLPTLGGLTLLTGLISALANFNVFGGTNLAGVTVHGTAREAL